MRDGTYWVHSVCLCCGRQRSKHWQPTEDCLSIQQGRYSCLKLCLFIAAITRFGIHTYVLLISAVHANVCVRSVSISLSWNMKSLNQIFTIHSKVSVDQSPGTRVVLPSSQILDHVLASANFKILTKVSFVHVSV